MKGVTAKIVVIIIMYFVMFKYLNVNIYEGMKTPWFSLDIVSSYFLSFFGVRLDNGFASNAFFTDSSETCV